MYTRQEWLKTAEGKEYKRQQQKKYRQAKRLKKQKTLKGNQSFNYYFKDKDN
jgi:hypothetical protein